MNESRTARTARRLLALLAMTVVVGGGCSAPFAVERLSPREAQLEMTANVLTTGKPSDFSLIVLRKHDLDELYTRDPAAALASLREIAIANDGPDYRLFALAELSYAHAENGGGRPYYLAAALYAYSMLFPTDDARELNPIDSRVRLATDIYNRAVAEAFENADASLVTLQSGTYELPFGALTVEFDESSLEFGDAHFEDFLRIADYEIRGFRNRYRISGIGAPVAPALKAPRDTVLGKYSPSVLRVPSTVLLRVDDPRAQIANAHVKARLEFYSFSNDTSALINGHEIPLESEPTASLAAGVAESKFWKSELSRFLGGRLTSGDKTSLVAIEPGRGRIPVIFVHGTNSSAARWANMANDLMNDPEIHRRFSFWFFSYMSSQPIALSARELRSSLTDAVKLLGRNLSEDSCGNAMVVIGHSQGGLLTKMTAIHSGDRFWRKISDQPFEEASLPTEAKTVIGEALFIDPLPFVKRVIFIATPHRGSFLAGPQFVRRLVARLVTLPVDLVKAGAALSGGAVDYKTAESTVSLERLPTSVDNMSPGNSFIQALADIPVDQGIIVNSIIPVKEGFDPYQEGNDGVVEYQSAHIEGVESELVVRSAHSTQSNPHTIEEVRRILKRHAEAFPCTPYPLQANEQPDADIRDR